MPLLSDTIGGLHFAAIDFESAGAARGETDQPVQIGIAACSRLEDEPELWTSYIAVEKPVLWSASQVHGITTEMLADAPSFPSLWPEIRSRLGQSVVVGHNPATERKFLRRFPGHGFGRGWIRWPWAGCAFPVWRIIPCLLCAAPWG